MTSRTSSCTSTSTRGWEELPPAVEEGFGDRIAAEIARGGEVLHARSKTGRYGLGYVVVGRLLAQQGGEGLRAVGVATADLPPRDARRRYAEAAALAEDPASWREAIHAELAADLPRIAAGLAESIAEAAATPAPALGHDPRAILDAGQAWLVLEGGEVRVSLRDVPAVVAALARRIEVMTCPRSPRMATGSKNGGTSAAQSRHTHGIASTMAATVTTVSGSPTRA